MMRLRCGKQARNGAVPGGKFRDQRAAGGYALCQLFMIARIDLVEPAGENCNGGTFRVERALVTGGVDAQRETTGDGETGAREGRRELAGRGAPARGRISAADHGQLRLTQDADVTAHEEDGRSVRRLAQQRRVVGGRGRQQHGARGFEPAQVGVDERLVGRGQPGGGVGS